MIPWPFVGPQTQDLEMSARRLSIAIVTLLLLAAPRAAFAQHETAADLLDGERAFRQSCANCHGPDGNLIPGIDFSRGQFRGQFSDDDLVRIIRTGIPNTAMPPSPNMTEPQARQVVAYLRSLPKARADSVSGDAARGKTVFDSKGGCTSCHRVGVIGSRVGPELTNIGAVRGAAELQRSLVDPTADVQPTNRFYRVVLKDGTAVSGRLLGHDTFTVQLLDTKEQLRSFVKADLREHGFAPSPMPSFRGTLTPQELADVVSYLASLKAPRVQ
jgi:cytochrome c oxidase cbb3-type subunit III